MPARPAHDAHDAFGMNTHLGYQNPENTNRFTEETVDLLLELGVGKVRQKLYCDENRSLNAARSGLSRLMAAGVKVCAPTLIDDDATSLEVARARMDLFLDELERNPDTYDLRLIEAFPGLNEPNGGKKATAAWAQQTRWAQQAIYEQTRARHAFDHVAVQGPPLNRRGGRGAQGVGGRNPGAGQQPQAAAGLSREERRAQRVAGRLTPEERQERRAAGGGRLTREERQAQRAAGRLTPEERQAQRAERQQNRRGGPAPGQAGPVRGFEAVLSSDAAEVGDISHWVDRADMHIYPGDQDTFNGGPPQAFVEAVRGMYLAGRPVSVTESGWSNCSPDDPDGQAYTGGGKSCPESVTAKYAPKAPLNALLLGHQAIYAYVMLENQPPYADAGHNLRSSKFGYIRTPGLEPSTWERKAQFHAMRRFLALFADPGPAFQPAGLPLGIAADCPDLQSMLFQRRTGQHLLALWRTVDLYACDPKTNAGSYLQIPPAKVTVTVDGDRPLDLFQPSFKDGSVGTWKTASLTLDVGDELLVLAIG